MSSAAENRAAAIRRFAGPGGDYYVCAFRRIGERRGYAFSLNRAAALGAPVWLGARRLWGAFWPFLIAELVAWIVIALALGGGVNAEAQARVERLETLVQKRQVEAAAALAGDPQAAVTQSLVSSVESLERALEQARDAAEAAGGSACRCSLLASSGSQRFGCCSARWPTACSNGVSAPGGSRTTRGILVRISASPAAQPRWC